MVFIDPVEHFVVSHGAFLRFVFSFARLLDFGAGFFDADHFLVFFVEQLAILGGHSFVAYQHSQVMAHLLHLSKFPFLARRCTDQAVTQVELVRDFSVTFTQGFTAQLHGFADVSHGFFKCLDFTHIGKEAVEQEVLFIAIRELFHAVSTLEDPADKEVLDFFVCTGLGRP